MVVNRNLTVMTTRVLAQLQLPLLQVLAHLDLYVWYFVASVVLVVTQMKEGLVAEQFPGEHLSGVGEIMVEGDIVVEEEIVVEGEGEGEMGVGVKKHHDRDILFIICHLGI